MNKFLRRIVTPVAVFAASLGVALSMANQRDVVGAEALESVVQFGSGKTNNWTTNYQNLGSDYIGIATTDHYGEVTSTNLFGAGNVLDSDLVVTFKIGTYGGTGQQGTFAVALLDSLGTTLSIGTGDTALTGSSESYKQGPTITVNKPVNPENISSIKVYLSDVGSVTTSTYIRLQELTLTYTTIVSGPTLTSISVTNPPTKTNYFEGETFDSSGIEVTATYSDNSTAIVTSEVMYSPAPLVAGEPVIASYLGETTTVSGITVTAINTTGITLLTPGTEIFTLGQNFNSFGLSIEVDKNNSTTEIITSGLNVSGVDTMVLGVQYATVEYDGFTTNYSVTVTNNGASVGDLIMATDLFISEYIEGASNDKAIEIFNGTSSSVSLSNYSLKINANANTTWSSPISLGSTTLVSGGAFVIANSSANSTILNIANMTSGSLTHNGDDAIGLFKNDVLIDIFGIFGEDPGAGWTIGDITNATVDNTITRNGNVFEPTTTWNTSEWTILEELTTTNLGTHDFASPDVTALEQATAYANYVWSGRGDFEQGTCVDVLADLEEEYGYMSTDAKNLFDGSTDELFINAQYRLSYLRAWVAANSPGGTANPLDLASNTSITLLIGILGLTSVVGFYLVSKKKYDN